MGCIRGQSNVFETNFGINVSLNQFGCVCVCISLKSPEKLSQIQRVFGKPVVTWTLQCIVNQIYEALAGKKYPEKVPNSSSLHLVLKWRWSCQLIYSMNRGFPITIMLDNIFGIIFFFFSKKGFQWANVNANQYWCWELYNFNLWILGEFNLKALLVLEKNKEKNVLKNAIEWTNSIKNT